MKNYDPVSYNRDKWTDIKHTKFKPNSCPKGHSFCNFQYEWGRETQKTQAPINLPINSSLPSVNLPAPRQKIISINYDSITQENIDDWIAQSMNRHLGSLLNPQKKFFLPSVQSQFEKDVRKRYRKNDQLKKINEDETYFKTSKPRKKSKGYLSNEKKSKLGEEDLLFDFRNLEPHQEMGGTPIKINEMKKLKKKQIVRRNAVLLEHDVHYARFLKEFNKEKKEKNTTPPKTHENEITPMRNMIYSFNLQSMKRNDQFEDVPNSIVEKQYERIKTPNNDFLSSHRALMNKQEELHEKYRELMNDKTKFAINQIKQVSNNHHKQPNSKMNQLFGGSLYSKKKAQYSKQPTHYTQTDAKMKNQKSSIEQKIIKLLNDMQVQSQKIDEDMSKLCIHGKQIFLMNQDNRTLTKWIAKAEEKIKQGQNLLAIDCYKQAIIIHPEEFFAVYNIAVLLEKENMLDAASKWFQVARQFKTDADRVTFGLAVVKLKQRKFEQALSQISELILKLEQNEKSEKNDKIEKNDQEKKLPILCYYIRALCHKQLLDFKKAKEDYKKIQKDLIPSNYNILPDFIFSIVFSKVRRIPLSFNSLSYMLFKETVYIILYENRKKMKEAHEKVEDIADKLVNEPFFKRFSVKLIKKFLKFAQYDEIQKDQIIFCEKNKTSIILNGLVSMKSHEKIIEKPSIISVLGRGGVIGSGELENFISWKPNIWFTALSPVQLITVPRYEFETFWKGQITFELDYRFNFLRNIQLFRGLSEATLFKLCELFKVVKYEKNSILFNDCSYRVQIINKAGRGYGLSKPIKKTDPRFITSHALGTKSLMTQTQRNKGKSKIFSLIKKHIFKFNQMKFSRLKYPGLFIVKSGEIEIEDDKGFRCSGIITSGEFFGESLIIDIDGFHKYGRMVVQSEQAQVYLLELDSLVWLFSEQDKNIMIKNCQKRQAVQTVSFLRNRHSECLMSKFGCRKTNW